MNAETRFLSSLRSSSPGDIGDVSWQSHDDAKELLSESTAQVRALCNLSRKTDTLYRESKADRSSADSVQKQLPPRFR